MLYLLYVKYLRVQNAYVSNLLFLIVNISWLDFAQSRSKNNFFCLDLLKKKNRNMNTFIQLINSGQKNLSLYLVHL